MRARDRGGEHARPTGRGRPGGRRPAEISRQKSPVPHAMSSTRASGASRSERDRRAPPRDVEAEREDPVEAVVARRDGVEHRVDRGRLLGRFGKHARYFSRATGPRVVGSPRRSRPRSRSRDRPPRGAPARPRAAPGGSGARPAWSPREEHRERVDEPRRLLVVGHRRVAQRLAHVLVEHRDRLLRDHARRSWWRAREHEELVEREAPSRRGACPRRRPRRRPRCSAPRPRGRAARADLRARPLRAARAGCRSARRSSSSERNSSASSASAASTAARAARRSRRARRSSSRPMSARVSPWRRRSRMRASRSRCSGPYQPDAALPAGGGSSRRFW